MGHIPEIEYALLDLFKDRAYYIEVANYDDVVDDPVEKFFRIVETSYELVDVLCIYANHEVNEVNTDEMFNKINNSEKMNFGCAKLNFSHATCKLKVNDTTYYCTFATLTVSRYGGITMSVITRNIRKYFPARNTENIAEIDKISLSINSRTQTIDAAILQHFCEYSKRDNTKIFATKSGTYPGSAFYASVVYHIQSKKPNASLSIEEVIGKARIDLNEFLTKLHNIPEKIAYTGSISDIFKAFSALKKWYLE